jgi:hypothetical protein
MDEQPGAGAKRLAKTNHAAIYRYWRQQITGVRSDLTSRYIDERLGTEACSDRGSRNDGTVISEVDLGLRDLSARLSGLRGCHFERGQGSMVS